MTAVLAAPSLWRRFLLAFVRFAAAIWGEKSTTSGLFLRLRAENRLMPTVRELAQSMKGQRASHQAKNAPKLTDRLVILGGGMAGFTFARQALERGYRDLTLVIGDDASLGGKCLNSGCMPSEFFLARMTLPLAKARAEFEQFRSRMRSGVRRELEKAGVKFVGKQGLRVAGRELQIDDDSKLTFDQLIVATGSQPARSERFKNAITLDDFWALERGVLVVVSKRHLTALSLASIAQARGLDVRVVFEDDPPLEHLPSVRFFLEELARSGIEITVGARAECVGERSLSLTGRDGKKRDMTFEHLLFVGQDTPNLPEVDGRQMSVSDVDLRWGCLRGRPDISVIGDAAGYLAATEAEMQARCLLDAWRLGQPIDLTIPEKLPFRLHAVSSLAMVGPPTSLLKADWQTADFAQIGWSAVYGTAGQCWYLFDPASKRVTALHLCHPMAGELISLAAALIQYPVDDLMWASASVHPSGAEIFKVVADQCRRQLTIASNNVAATDEGKDIACRFDASVVEKITGQGATKDSGFLPEEMQLGTIDRNPVEYFAVLSGLTAAAPERRRPILLRRDGAGKLSAGTALEFSYRYEDTLSRYLIEVGDRKVTMDVVN